MHFINWQRDIAITERNGKKVVIKKNKITTKFNENVLVFVYSLFSVILLHPSSPIKIGKFVLLNEGKRNREKLNEMGISTPNLIMMTKNTLIEEYIEGGNLYHYLKNNGDPTIVFDVGMITKKLHNNGLCFVDNKAQNYLVRNLKIVRTDLGLIQKQKSEYARSLDIGIFLASLLDLEKEKYLVIEKFFLEGYRYDNVHKIPSLSIVVRNMIAIVLASNHNNLAKNLLNI